MILTCQVVGLLGEDDETIKAGIKSAAEKFGRSGRQTDTEETTLTNLLDKIKTIAEKIQKNTSTMIPDQQFLSQEQVATTILTLADDEQAKILNGKIIPGDRVFYPVKPHVASSVPKVESNEYSEKNCIVTGNLPDDTSHNHWRYEGRVSKIEEHSKLTELDRDTWDGLVWRFIFEPALRVKWELNDLVPGGSDDPRLFKDTKGRIVIIGPSLPVGKKISGHERAKVEVFRGALRPFVTTVNQELSDVLKSNIRVFLILPGSIDGKEPSHENLVNTINYLMTDEKVISSSEVIFHPDETR